jgi:hypothetical protein
MRIDQMGVFFFLQPWIPRIKYSNFSNSKMNVTLEGK